MVCPLPSVARPIKCTACDPDPCAQGTPSLAELKLQYYTLFIRYHEHDNNYLEICRCYKAIYETAAVADDSDKWQPVSVGPFC